jgi:hypothetical protein
MENAIGSRILPCEIPVSWGGEGNARCEYDLVSAEKPIGLFAPTSC